MALLSPALPPLTPSGGLHRELDVLWRLQSSLSEGYEVFHSVSWHSLHEGRDRHGEIDIVVLGPTGNVLLMEIKAGAVSLTNGEIFKLYADGASNVGRQTRVQFAAMVHRLQQAGLYTFVTNCLVLPDYVLGTQQVVSLPPERIIDATRFEQLGSYVLEFLAQGSAPAGSAQTQSSVQALRQFLCNEFNVTLDLRALGAQVRDTTLRLADGLATWVPRITTPSGVIRVQATAGSGKTQLALRLLQDAAASGLRSLYVCYNRSLADHIGRIAPPKAKVASYHELCVEYYRHSVGEPDFAAQDTYAELTQHYCEAVDQNTEMQGRYQLLVIDEGQDFDPAWVAALLPQLTEDGRIYLLEDEAQRLYARDEFDLSDVVVVNCRDNFRTPRAVCSVINALALTEPPIDARAAYEGELPNFYTYSSDKTLLRETERAVQALVTRGIALSDIAVISWRGLAKALLVQTPALGQFSLRRPTGKYTNAGDAIWTDGDLLVESVYRFKGQSAAGIVLTEVDFEELDEGTKRKLFVGLTRAQLAVEVVLSERAATCLSAVV